MWAKGLHSGSGWTGKSQVGGSICRDLDKDWACGPRVCTRAQVGLASRKSEDQSGVIQEKTSESQVEGPIWHDLDKDWQVASREPI